MASDNQVASHNQIEDNNQTAPAPSNETAAGKSGRKKPSTESQLKKYLLLLATLVATVTYVAGLNLPGGVWQDTQHDHPVGDPILPDAHHRRYLAFYYCNATSFAASVVVCLLLLVPHEDTTGWAVVLEVVMALDLLGLMGAYAAGSCRDAFTTICSSVLMCGVFAYIVPAVVSKLQNDGNLENQDREELHEVFMLLATFAVTITYVAGLNPPGGFWGNNTQDGHRASDPILQDHNSKRYRAFFFCNTTAFVASLLIIMLLLDRKMRRESLKRFVPLYVFIVIVLLGLMGAYTAGSCREGDNSTYVVCLACAILAYIFLQVAITKNRKAISERLPCILLISRETQHDEALDKARDFVMLLATLVASITYQAGQDPPGGVWPDDREGHKGGDPILLTTHPTRYKVFFYSNSTAFVTSLVVVVMVQNRKILKRHTLEAAMILDLFGLISAYAAGSCRDLSTSIDVVALAGVVLVYVVIHIVFFTLDHRDNPQDDDVLDSRREVLLTLAILAATLTYQAGLTPPGGFWSADDKFGHHAGFPVLLDNYPRRYKAFFYCNAASFMASVALIVLLANPNLYRPGIRCYALYVCMVAGIFGLMGAYAAGSSRHLRTSIYVLTLVAAVFVFVTLQVVIFWLQPDLNTYLGKICPIFRRAATQTTGNGSSAQGGSSTRNESSKSEDRDLREYLMLLGIMAASVTYQTGLKPPGGLWQDNNNHYAGNSILHDVNKRRYLAFFYSNSTSFMASIVVIVLLLPRTLDDIDFPLWPMHTAILLDMFALLVAYAAGSTRDQCTSMSVILLVIPVTAYIGIAAYAALVSRKYKDDAPKEIHISTGDS